MLFLSYAEEDGARAREIAEWFRERHIDVYWWEDPAERGGRFIDTMERKLNEAEVFLALESPNFIASPWCDRETQVALLREEQMRQSRPDARFIRVLKIADTPRRFTKFIDTYDALDVTGSSALDQPLSQVAATLMRTAGTAGTAGTAVTPAADRAAPPPPSFRNREYELDMVLRSLGNPGGDHFWLLISPPQLGKTWFMDQLAVRLRDERANWSARRVDIREYPDHLRANVPWLLGHLLRLDASPASVDGPELQRIATRILTRDRPHLCLLDSAELLTDETIKSLRAAMAEVYRMVHDGNKEGVRIAFVVASRWDDVWRGLTGEPRLTTLRLSEFRLPVVVEALRDLAGQMSRPYSAAELQEHARLVYQVSEGLPGLLALCLQWIRGEEWSGIQRLAERDQFLTLARPYVDNELLGADNLFRKSRPDERVRLVVGTALQSLVTYRLITQSHVRHHIEDQSWLPPLLGQLGWSVPELYGAISSTALLMRRIDLQPWQEVQGALRRLLFRYFYATDDGRAAAHRLARHFLGTWSDGLKGTDQVTGLLECLWHQAAELRYKRESDAAEVLRASVVTLFGTLKPLDGITATELRRSAADKMRDNTELQDTLTAAAPDTPGLFEELVALVDVPDGG